MPWGLCELVETHFCLAPPILPFFLSAAGSSDSDSHPFSVHSGIKASLSLFDSASALATLLGAVVSTGIVAIMAAVLM
jgi:hypothetical protein